MDSIGADDATTRTQTSAFVESAAFVDTVPADDAGFTASIPDHAPLIDAVREADPEPGPEILDAILHDVDELPGRQFSVSFQSANEAPPVSSSLLQDIQDEKRAMSSSRLDEASPSDSSADDADAEVTASDVADHEATDSPDPSLIPWIDTLSAPAPARASASDTEREAYAPARPAAVLSETPDDGTTAAPKARPARPLIVVGAPQSAADETPPSVRPKRPRPRLARPHIGKAPPPAAPAAMAAAATDTPPPPQGLLDPKHRPALALGVVALVGLVLWAKASMHGHDAASVAEPTSGSAVVTADGSPASLATGELAVRATLRNGVDVSASKSGKI
jgi:hypothetical protein